MNFKSKVILALFILVGASQSTLATAAPSTSTAQTCQGALDSNGL